MKNLIIRQKKQLKQGQEKIKQRATDAAEALGAGNIVFSCGYLSTSKYEEDKGDPGESAAPYGSRGWITPPRPSRAEQTRELRLTKECNRPFQVMESSSDIPSEYGYLIAAFNKGIVVQQSNLEQVKAILEGNIDNITDQNSLQIPLYLAAFNKPLATVEALLSANVDVNAPNKDNWTALHVASQNGRFDVVDALLKAKANVNIQNQNGWTALHMASQNGHFEVVKALLEAKANVNTIGMNNLTALHLAALKGHVEVVEALLQANADVSIQNAKGKTALDVANAQGNHEIVKMLILPELKLAIQNKKVGRVAELLKMLKMDEFDLHNQQTLLNLLIQHRNVNREVMTPKQDLQLTEALVKLAIFCNEKETYHEIKKDFHEKYETNPKNKPKEVGTILDMLRNAEQDNPGLKEESKLSQLITRLSKAVSTLGCASGSRRVIQPTKVDVQEMKKTSSEERKKPHL